LILIGLSAASYVLNTAFMNAVQVTGAAIAVALI
jgi:hypothetical protein